MSEQSLDGEEQLSIRWAREDPLPVSVTEQQEYLDLMLTKLEEKGHSLKSLEGQIDPETGERIQNGEPEAYPEPEVAPSDTGNVDPSTVDEETAGLLQQYAQYNQLVTGSNDTAGVAFIAPPPGLDAPASKPQPKKGRYALVTHNAEEERKRLHSIAAMNAILDGIDGPPPGTAGADAAAAADASSISFPPGFDYASASAAGGGGDAAFGGVAPLHRD